MKEIKQNLPIVTIIGRTNTGKSTLFNRLTEKKVALISNIPGTTRDKRYGECEWQGKTVVLTDTAGLDVESDEAIDLESVKQAKDAIKEAHGILFIVDVKSGLLPQDKEYANLLRKSNKPVILVVNKVDAEKHMNQLDEFYTLGFKVVEAVSAKTGAGTGDLCDSILEMVKDVKITTSEVETNPNPENQIKVSIIGKPNAGKSSLLNAIIGEERAIVSPVPHTTRDSQDATIEYTSHESTKTQKHETQSTEHGAQNPEQKNKTYHITFIDTAGIIKKRKISDKLQEMSIEQSIDNLRDSDIALLMIDASKEITMQDKNLAREILENKKSLVFVVNKWDLMKEKTTHSDKEYTQFLHRHFPYLTWAPIVFTSAKEKQKISRLIDVIIEIDDNQNKTIPQEELDALLKKILRKKRPPCTQGTKAPFVHTLSQVRAKPLRFKVVASQAENIHFSYRRYILNEIRKKFNLMGCGLGLEVEEG